MSDKAIENICVAIMCVAGFIFLWAINRPHRQQYKSKLPYNPNAHKSSSECRFWGHQWSSWRRTSNGNIQARECVECGRVENRIDPYNSEVA